MRAISSRIQTLHLCQNCHPYSTDCKLTKAFRKTRSVGTFNRFTETLYRWKNLMREIVFEIYQSERINISESALIVRNHHWPILSELLVLRSSSGCLACSACTDFEVSPFSPIQKIYGMTSPPLAVPPLCFMRKATVTCGWLLASG